MQKYGVWATQMINCIHEVHSEGLNTTNADSLRAMNGRKDGRSGSAVLVALPDEAPASYHYGLNRLTRLNY